MTKPVLRVAVASPLRQTFDYLPPAGVDPQLLRPGMRLKIPFGRSERVGMIIGLAASSQVDTGRLKAALAVLDAQALLAPDDLALLEWASTYYHHPLGEVIMNALPPSLRQGQAAHARGVTNWCVTQAGARADPALLARAPRQAALLELLRRRGLPAAEVAQGGWRAALQGLAARGWVEARETAMEGPGVPRADARNAPPELNDAQRQAVDGVLAAQGFQPFLLDGVTGSGKTEVYLRIIEQVIAQGRQALVLVPEIGLTPQFIERFQRRFDAPIALLHSGLSEHERLDAWLRARDGSAPIVLGTRSAVFTPLQRPGVFIIDEEHDLSFKQQDGFRYHARDVAVMRAHRVRMPVLLGSATPSLESLYNVRLGRYQRLSLPQRAGLAVPPAISVMDVRHQSMDGGVSAQLLARIAQHLQRAEQVLLFLNRRGHAPVLLCHACGWVATCKRCDARMVIYRAQRHVLRCHHCGAQRAQETQCPACASTADLCALGQGTERVEQTLERVFGAAGIVRIDRDSTRRKGALQGLLARAHQAESRLLVGTQMLAKGHHLPNVTLVGILDADQGLFGVDFRGPERMAQLIVQVAGRAGRSDKPGQVIIQTHQPDHPLLRTLIDAGYTGFAEAALAERELAELPPYRCMALLRAEAVQAQVALDFLAQAHDAASPAQHDNGIQLLGPAPAPMERRAGRYRAQLLVQSAQRSQLHRFLDAWIPRLERLPLARKARWSLDVDPMEMI